MSIRAGMDRTRYTQLRHPADREENVVGTYPSGFEHLNIRNPQPGYRYFWEGVLGSNGQPSRSKLTHALSLGGQVVRAEDPERRGGEELDYGGLDFGTTLESKELVLMRIPLEKQRVLDQRHEELSRSRYDSARSGSDYLERDKITGSASAPGTSKTGRPIYFARDEHGQEEVEHG